MTDSELMKLLASKYPDEPAVAELVKRYNWATTGWKTLTQAVQAELFGWKASIRIAGNMHPPS